MKTYLYKVAIFLTAFVVVTVILAVVLPYNRDGYLREQKVKMSMIENIGRMPSIVLLGGSNVAFGFDSKVIEQRIGMPVINAGLHAGLGLRYIMYDCLPRLRKGDILVMSPEYDHFFDCFCDGQGSLADIYYLNGMTLPEKVSAGQRRAIVENTPAWLKRKVECCVFELANIKSDHIYRMSSFNKYGDVVAHWSNDSQQDGPKGKEKTEELVGFNEDFFKEFVECLKCVERHGVKVVMFPPAIEHGTFIDKSLKINYLSERLATVGFPFACAPDKNAMESEMFYDTAYHLNHKGAVRHSETLVDVLDISNNSMGKGICLNKTVEFNKSESFDYTP